MLLSCSKAFTRSLALTFEQAIHPSGAAISSRKPFSPRLLGGPEIHATFK